MSEQALNDQLEQDSGAEDTLRGKYLTFQIGEEEFGIEIKYVNEIIGIQKITDLPDVAHYIKGVINLRGKVIPVVDVRLRFGMQEREYDERTCIIYVIIQNIAVGLIVDSVSEVLGIPATDIEDPPKVNEGASNRYIKGLGKVGESVKILLNVNKLLFDSEIEQLATVSD
jgi:purine-binding chemotaxis protein CheW